MVFFFRERLGFCGWEFGIRMCLLGLEKLGRLVFVFFFNNSLCVYFYNGSYGYYFLMREFCFYLYGCKYNLFKYLVIN